MRLIDAEALKKAMTDYEEECGDIIPKKYFDFIDNTPTIEPFERIGAICNENCGYHRPQGEWLVTAEDNDGVHRICCPFCSYEKGSNNTDTIIVTFHKFPKICENCGADMRKGNAELYREETCKNKDSCDDYKYWHCIGCNGCKKGGKE